LHHWKLLRLFNLFQLFFFLLLYFLHHFLNVLHTFYILSFSLLWVKIFVKLSILSRFINFVHKLACQSSFLKLSKLLLILAMLYLFKYNLLDRISYWWIRIRLRLKLIFVSFINRFLSIIQNLIRLKII
jgi:hypothetical protein